MITPFLGSGAHRSNNSRLTPLVKNPGLAITTQGPLSFSLAIPLSNGRMNEFFPLKSNGLIPRANFSRIPGAIVWIYLVQAQISDGHPVKQDEVIRTVDIRPCT